MNCYISYNVRIKESLLIVLFFFQAEDGIRDGHVTGVRRVLFRSKKTRDETFIEKDAAGHTVNRLESVAWIGGCTDTNEFNYLVVKSMRALGVVHIENQARV